MKKIVAFGPEKDVPSWNWVGFDTSRELSKYYTVKCFESFEKVPDCDVVVMIKQRPTDKFLEEAVHRKIKVVYAPIDFYVSREQLVKDQFMFRKCNLILSHCERLNKLILPYNKNTVFVDHNNKYALPEMASYKENGYILWVGGCQYVAYLAKWLRSHQLKYPVKILTDHENDRARYSANMLAHQLGIGLKIMKKSTNILGCEVHSWSERLQYEMMMECKAAIDIKGIEDFNQYHKPPTKAQKYVASGIPFAINPGTYSHEYFKNRGFDVACPTATTKWFSKEYWEKTREYGVKLRKETSIEAVGLKYKEVIDSL